MKKIKKSKRLTETKPAPYLILGSAQVFDKIAGLIKQARRKVATTINQEMVLLYWNIGKTIKEEIIKSKRAEYDERIVQSLTAQLVPRYGRGFSKRNLWYMVQLYEMYPILQSLLGEFKGLSWTHIITLLGYSLD